VEGREGKRWSRKGNGEWKGRGRDAREMGGGKRKKERRREGREEK